MDLVDIHVGSDVHSETNVVYFLYDDGSPAHDPISFEQDQKGYSQLENAMIRISSKHPQVIFHCGIEAAGPYWFPLGAFLKKLSLTVEVTAINPSVIKNFKKIQLTKIKTDFIDAKAVADYMRIFKPAPTDYFTDAHIGLRQLSRGIKFFSKQLTAVINQLHDQLAVSFPELNAKNVSETILAVLDTFPSASSLSKASDEELRIIRFRHTGRRPGIKAVLNLRELARKSIGIAQDSFSESYTRQLVQNIWFLNQQIEEADIKLQDYYTEHFEHTRIHTINGIGKHSAAIIIGEILDAGRFENVTHWIGYLGLYPQWNWSAKKQDKEWGMTHKGNKYLRHTLYCCTISAVQHNPIIRKHYHNQLSRGKKRMVAIGSCMRKLASLIFGVMKTQKDFNPFYGLGLKETKQPTVMVKKEEETSILNTVVNATTSFAGPRNRLASSSANILKEKNHSVKKGV